MIAMMSAYHSETLSTMSAVRLAEPGMHLWWLEKGFIKMCIKMPLKICIEMFKKYSPTGNRTLVVRVTGGNTHHYTIEEI